MLTISNGYIRLRLNYMINITGLPDNVSGIDVLFDFTMDTPGFWEGFWDRREGLGAGGADPDLKSQTLRRYHQLLWSRELPNGEMMNLEDGRSRFYLKWNDIYFGSDSITASFRHTRDKWLIQKVQDSIPDYKSYTESYLHHNYTLGGMMILPAIRWSINQARGCNPRIRDRWDLTLECIRRYYLGESTPLDSTLTLPTNVHFFELFVDFKGFVDFFFLQDCVASDYSKVVLWLDTPLFETNPIPKTVDAYRFFIDKEIEFVESRNNRIDSFIKRQT